MVLLAVTVVGVVAMKAEYAAGEVGSIRAYRDTGNPRSLAAGWLEAVVVVLLMVAVVVPVARILTVEVTDAVDSLHRQLIHKYNSG